jgi:uncharacterized protein
MKRGPKLPRFNPRTSRYPLRYGCSRIHRVGVFAVEAIPRGKKVIEYTGERLTVAEAAKRFWRIWAPGGERPIYLLPLNRRWVLDGAFHGSGAERINHCCAPNLTHKRIPGRVWYVSRRRIQPGEELTIDYGTSPDAPIIRCSCGAPNCRGTLNRKK